MSRAELEEELAYLRRSLEDLESEHEAGDIAEVEYARLKSSYSSRLARAEGELAREPFEESAPAPARPAGSRRLYPQSRRARLVTGWSAFLCFLLAALLLSLSLAAAGPFSTGPSLSTNERVQIMLAEASELGSSGQMGLALSTYAKVLALRPRQPEALAGAGWLSRIVGLSSHDPSMVREGDAEIEAAVRSDPGYAIGRAYDGVMLYVDRKEAKPAVSQFDAMLVDHPSAALVYSVHLEAEAAYKAAGQPVPPSFARARPPRSKKASKA